MKTKFFSLCIMLSIVSIFLAACNGVTATSVSNRETSSLATKLAMGTLKLEGTDQAVTAAQATELLTLWQAYQTLSASDTTSQVELDAVVKQIQGVMTSEQTQAIEKIQLTSQSVSEVLQSVGVNASVGASSSTQKVSAVSQAASGGDPGGMPADGGSIPMGDLGSGITTQSTPNATQAQSGAQTTQVNSMLLNALINMLETKCQTTG